MFPGILNLSGAAPYFLAAFFGGYFIGALPFGLWIGRAFGLGDVRSQGSGNIGATNILRLGGWRLGLLTFVLDIAKGVVPALLAAQYGPNTMVLAGLGAFIGHCFSVYLRFSGGKGIATAFGIFLIWRWEIALICAGVWALTAFAARRSSAASLATIAAAALLFPYFEIWDASWAVFVMAIIALWRHRANIGRLIKGVEPKIGARS